MTKNPTQKTLMLGINLFSVVFLWWFISQVTKAYIGMSYPDVSETSVASLISMPNLFGLITSFLIGPIAMKMKKTTLACGSILSVVIYCAIFYLNGKANGPFGLYYIACVFAGLAQGSHAVLLNSIISLHFSPEERGGCIANYNVFLNLGALFVLQVAGIIASANDGAQWYNAYLLGILPLIGMIVFYIFMKKCNADEPTIVVAASNDDQPAAKASFSDIPKKVIPVIITLALAHACFYIAQFAFNTNVSSYVITEYKLGTAAQAGTASSMVRLAMVVFTALFPVFRKILKNWMVPCGYLSAAIGLTIMMVGKSLPAAYACAIFIGLATSLAHSELYAKASSYVPILCVPVAVSMVSGITNIGSSTSVYIMSFFSDLLGGGMQNKFIVGIVFAVVAFLIAAYMFVFKKPVEAEQA